MAPRRGTDFESAFPPRRPPVLGDSTRRDGGDDEHARTASAEGNERAAARSVK
jgi:hypothetical protein